jgi:proliferating cell nuclear antigen PCNA
MFIIEFNDSAALLRKIVDVLKDRIQEGTLIVHEEGMTFQSMDTSHIAMTDLVILPGAASAFDCDDRVHALGIRLDTLAKIFKCSNSHGNCRISYDEETLGDVLSIEFNNGGNVASFEMRLIDGTDERMEVPEESIPRCQQSVSTTDLQSKLKDLAQFAEDVEIGRQGAELTFKAAGDTAKAAFSMDLDDDQGGETCKATYAISYLQWFAKASSLSSEALLCIDGELPLLLQLTAEDSFCLRFFLSPKIAVN